MEDPLTPPLKLLHLLLLRRAQMEQRREPPPVEEERLAAELQLEEVGPRPAERPLAEAPLVEPRPVEERLAAELQQAPTPLLCSEPAMEARLLPTRRI